jgi:arylsulfatase A-like enzyme
MTMQLSRRDFAAAAAAGSAAPNGTAAARRPNLVFVFSDQQSYDMLGSSGNRQIATPELDRFARESVRFRHCVANAPLCTPYRGILLSGQHSLRNGAIENDIRMLPGRGSYFGEVLRDSGYRTGYIGKWHLYGGNRVRPIPAGEYRYGFDGAFLSNNCTVVFDENRAYYWDQDGERRRYGDWEPYAQTKQAEDFLDRQGDDPFALFLSWHPPHNWAPVNPPAKVPEDGYGAPEEMLRLYDPEAIRVRGNCENTASHRRVYRGHMAMCSSLDRAFGQLMKKLKDKGLDGNTIVVFTSDHGDTLLSHGFRYNKMRPEAESIRVPLLVRFPGELRPRNSDLLVGTLDLMPTLLGLLGLPVPSTCDGRNLAAEMRRGADNAVDSVPLFLLNLDWRGVYTRRYTYAFDTSSPGGDALYRDAYFRQPRNLRWNCLYDRERDPWELRNLHDEADGARIKNRLHERTRTWMRKFGDTGLPYDRVLRAAMSPEDLALRKSGEFFQKRNGILRGSPSELLAGASGRP